MDILRKLYATITVTDVVAEEFGEQFPEWINIRRGAPEIIDELLNRVDEI